MVGAIIVAFMLSIAASPGSRVLPPTSFTHAACVHAQEGC